MRCRTSRMSQVHMETDNANLNDWFMPWISPMATTRLSSSGSGMVPMNCAFHVGVRVTYGWESGCWEASQGICSLKSLGTRQLERSSVRSASHCGSRGKRPTWLLVPRKAMSVLVDDGGGEDEEEKGSDNRSREDQTNQAPAVDTFSSLGDSVNGVGCRQQRCVGHGGLRGGHWTSIIFVCLCFCTNDRPFHRTSSVNLCVVLITARCRTNPFPCILLHKFLERPQFWL